MFRIIMVIICIIVAMFSIIVGIISIIIIMFSVIEVKFKTTSVILLSTRNKSYNSSVFEISWNERRRIVILVQRPSPLYPQHDRVHYLLHVRVCTDARMYVPVGMIFHVPA